MILQAALLLVNVAAMVVYTWPSPDILPAWLFLTYSVFLLTLVAWLLWRWSTRRKRVRWVTVALQAVILAFNSDSNSSGSWLWLWLPLVVIVALLLPAASRWFDR